MFFKKKKEEAIEDNMQIPTAETILKPDNKNSISNVPIIENEPKNKKKRKQSDIKDKEESAKISTKEEISEELENINKELSVVEKEIQETQSNLEKIEKELEKINKMKI